jgi:hypothetical protein
LNSTELARNRFNSLFAAQDAKEARAAASQKKPVLMPVKKAATKNAKSQ